MNPIPLLHRAIAAVASIGLTFALLQGVVSLSAPPTPDDAASQLARAVPPDSPTPAVPPIRAE